MTIYKWCHYTKSVRGRLSAEHYFPINETNTEYLRYTEDIMLERAQEWAETVNGSGQNGFRFSYELIEKPPIEWLNMKISTLSDDIRYASEYKSAILLII